VAIQDKLGVVSDVPQISLSTLGEIWTTKDALPTLNRYQKFLYYLQRGVDTLTALPMSTMITIMTITVSLFVFAGFLLGLRNVDKILSSAGTTNFVSVYLQPDLAEGKAEEVFASLQRHPLVRSAEFISSKQAIELLKKELGSRGDVLQGLDENSKLPAAVDLYLYRDELGADQTQKFVEDLRTRDEVDDVVHGSEWVDKVQGAVQVFRVIASVGLALALIVVVFVVSNTIKLAIYARRDELMIMQLVGAGRGFIQIPFLVAGVVQGAVGSLLAVTLLQGAFVLLEIELQKLVVFGLAIPELVFLSSPAVIGVVCFGIGVGVVGSLFALNKFMDSVN